ncbi:MAG: hypothetical protein HKM95_01010 [Inquilinus sp.]|nr:hypothetical protein [Inquilinus sp.]
MISGSFANQFMVPFGATATLLALIAAGLWVAVLGGKEKWRMPLAVLIGLAIGIAVPKLGISLPFRSLVLPLSVIGLGLLVVFDVVLGGLIGLAIGAVIFVYHGAAIGPRGSDFLGFLGFAVGALTALAAGIGFDSIVVNATSSRGVRVLGGLIALGGAWLLYLAL